MNRIENKPWVTIGIPSLDRGNCALHCVKDTLDKLMDDQDIEVLVLDNASEFERECYEEISLIVDTRLRYIRRNTTQTFQGQIIQILREARGDYLFLLSDEDFISQKALYDVLSILKITNYSVIYEGKNYQEATFANCFYLSKFLVNIADRNTVDWVTNEMKNCQENVQLKIYPHKVALFLLQAASKYPTYFYQNGPLYYSGFEECRPASMKKRYEIHDFTVINYRLLAGRGQQYKA